MPLLKSSAQYVFDHLDEIEKQIAMGVYHETICKDLALDGCEMSLPTFRKNLTRARAKKAKEMGIPRNRRLNLGDTPGSRLTPQELDQLNQLQMNQ